MPIPVPSDLQFILGAKITGLPNAVNPTEAVTLAQAQALLARNAFKDDVRVKAPGNVNLAAPGVNIDGLAMAVGDRVLNGNQTAGPENGIYVWNGAAVAMTRSFDAQTFDDLESAIVTVSEGTSAGTRWRQTAVNGTLGTTPINWVSDQTSVPNATETVSGIAEIATQAETDAGLIDNMIVTPLKLGNSVAAHKVTKLVIGDGVATSYSIPHPYATTDVNVEVRESTGARRVVLVENGTPDANTVQVIFAGAPPSNSYKVFVTKK